MTFESSPAQGLLPMELPSMSSAAGSRARTLRSLAKELGLRANAPDYGANTRDLLASYDRTSSSWKTSQLCLVEGLETFSETWPRSGMMRSGIAFQLVPLAHPTDEIAFGSLPTPTASNYGSNQSASSGAVCRPSLTQMARQNKWPTPWATPTARDWRSGKASPETMARNSRPLSEQVGGTLNPTWVEWLMGFPPNWTEV